MKTKIVDFKEDQVLSVSFEYVHGDDDDDYESFASQLIPPFASLQQQV